MSDGSEGAEDFCREVDSHVSRLIDSYRSLLHKAHIGETSPPQFELQIRAASAEIVYHCSAMLDQVNELKFALLLKQETVGHADPFINELYSTSNASADEHEDGDGDGK